MTKPISLYGVSVVCGIIAGWHFPWFTAGFIAGWYFYRAHLAHRQLKKLRREAQAHQERIQA